MELYLLPAETFNILEALGQGDGSSRSRLACKALARSSSPSTCGCRSTKRDAKAIIILSIDAH